MSDSRSEYAKKIAKKIIESSRGLAESYLLMDLIDSGIDGELLVEIVDILDRSGFIVDTKIPTGLQETLNTNIKDCTRILNTKYDKKIAQELALLKEPAQVYLGCQFDKNSDNKCEADSGLPVISRRFNSSSSYLLRFPVKQIDKDVIVIDDKVVSFDNSKFSHRSVN